MSGHFNTDTGISFTSVNFQVVAPTITSESFSGKVRRIGQGHQYYTFEVAFPPLTPYQWGPVAAFIGKQYGMVDAFTITLPEISYNTGVNAAFIGTPVVLGYYTNPANLATFVSGAPPAGTKTIKVSGLTANKNQVLRAGDFFKFAGDTHTKVYMVAGDLNSDASGNGILNFSGGLVRALTVGQGLVTNAVPFNVIFDSSVQEFKVGQGGMTEYSVKCREVW